MALKKKPEEHVNHERWLVSYADYITLLFAFFTTLYAISTVDAQKAGKLIYSIRQVFDLNIMPSSKPVLGADSTQGHSSRGPLSPKFRPIRVAGLPSSRGSGGNTKKLVTIASTLKQHAGGRGLGGPVHVTSDIRGVVISLEAGAFFAKGSSQLIPAAMKTLESVASVLSDAQLNLRIEGHTDSTKAGKNIQENWNLSTERAVSIVTYLIEKHGYPPRLLSAAGFGDTRPVASNETPDGKAKNRRIDIVVLREFPKISRIAWLNDEEQ